MPTYDEVSRQQLRALSAAIGQAEAGTRYVALQSALLSPWSARSIPARAPYASFIGDDHSPYEYSVAYGAAGAELRLLFEAQAETPTLLGNHDEALLVNRRLQSALGVSLARYDAVADLFTVSSAVSAGFSLWHAVCFFPDGKPQFKVYLNPQGQGAQCAGELVREVCARLQISDAGHALDRLRFRGVQQDELKYISLDLSDGAKARLKLYTCHHDVSAAELERSFAAAPLHRAGDVAAFCETMAPEAKRFDKKAVSSCLAFVAGEPAPKTVTLHLPIAHYAETDAVARLRIDAYMADNGMDELVHSRVLAAIARRPLRESSGIQSYASYRREESGMRLTVYLSPELFRAGVASVAELPQARTRATG